MNRNAVKQRFSVIGDSPRLNQALEIAIQVAPTDVTVLVIGENGTGKDVFSRIIHQLGKRKHRPFMAVNCGAIPEGTIDSELFGHEKGSFTSAYDSRKGYFEEVNGGVIFLDEIAEMPVQTQARLLRLLENGEYLRVGSSKVQKTDVRVVAATNKNLFEAIRKGLFREDLFYRLNTVTIQVPPLRERGSDIELLFRYFATEFATRYGRRPISLVPEAIQYLYDYHWPGNIRELRNFVEKLTVLTPPDAPLTSEELLRHLPFQENQLPVPVAALPNGYKNGQEAASHAMPTPDTEFVLRALFDLRNEVAELKRAVGMRVGQPYPADSVPILHNENYPGGFQPVEPVYTTILEPEIRVETVRDPVRNSTRFVGNASARIAHEPTTTAVIEESLSIEKKEKDLIQRALLKFDHNRKKAAHELGISERTLYRKIKAYNLD